MDARHYGSLWFTDGPTPEDCGLRPIALLDEPDVFSFDEYAEIAGRHFAGQIDATDPSTPVSLSMEQPFRMGGTAASLTAKLECCYKVVRFVRDAHPARRFGVCGLYETSWWSCQRPELNPRPRNRRAAELFADLVDWVDVGLYIPQDRGGNPTGTNRGAEAHIEYVVGFAVEQAALQWRKPVRVWTSHELQRGGRATAPGLAPPHYWQRVLEALTARLTIGQIDAIVRVAGWNEETGSPRSWTEENRPYLCAPVAA